MKHYRRLWTRRLLLPAVAACAGFLTSCGSGGTSLPITNCSMTQFVPNYADRLERLLNWGSLPVRVFFIQDSNYSMARQSAATAGFDQWVTATGGLLSYQVVGSQANADATVTFDPTTQDGLTQLHFHDYTMIAAEITLGVKDLPIADLQCVAAHEFGHTLGIDGHSDVPGDLMYAVHVIHDTCPITTRDLNTMKTGYCTLFTRGYVEQTPPSSSPSETRTIR